MTRINAGMPQHFPGPRQSQPALPATFPKGNQGGRMTLGEKLMLFDAVELMMQCAWLSVHSDSKFAKLIYAGYTKDLYLCALSLVQSKSTH